MVTSTEKNKNSNSDGTDLIALDPWLEPQREALKYRFHRYKTRLTQITEDWNSLSNFAKGHQYFGINSEKKGNLVQGWWYREWAPSASALFLFGDFNGWDRYSHPLKRDEWGVWSLFLPYEKYKDKFKHGSTYKVHVVAGGKELDRIPVYAKSVIQDDQTKDFSARLWMPSKPFKWTDRKFSPENNYPYKIYESHIGMAQEKEAVGSYNEFTENILPRIKKAGYNVIQLMAIQEHPYYGSFGYHVSSFFAPTSRFGTPDDLKRLINTAHDMGIAIIMDIVHSHAIKNLLEGMNEFDGTDHQYFHAGGRGEHPYWDSKVFDYGKTEVLRFLFSNLRYWLEEFHFDGFRFDGVTSMMYLHHGLERDFNNYDMYFNETDDDAITYLQLGNKLIHDTKPGAISIAEDMSGMPGLCRPIEEGGIGFDFRLSMGVPDFWIKILKERSDEDWNIHEIWGVLSNRRAHEKHLSYSESHDQALVGDKTIAFWLMDKEMYYHMNIVDENHIIDRGIALHKMIRFITLLLGGECYLNFMGNEFGHPEWIDFPREGNGWSYHYAKRQWSLVDREDLKYRFLADFDREMLALADKYKLLGSAEIRQLNMDTDNKVMVFERGDLIFAFNFHPSHSIPDYTQGVPKNGKYKVIFTTDEARFGGFGRIDQSVILPSQEIKAHDQPHSIKLYFPNRCALALQRTR